MRRLFLLWPILLETDPGNSFYAGLLGLSCTAVTQGPKPGCNALLTYAQSHPDDAKASTYAATMIQRGVAGDNEIALARKLLESAIKADPKLAEAQFQMAFLRQNRRTGRAAFRISKGPSPSSPTMHSPTTGWL
jgi:hypothetical protein